MERPFRKTELSSTLTMGWSGRQIFESLKRKTMHKTTGGQKESENQIIPGDCLGPVVGKDVFPRRRELWEEEHIGGQSEISFYGILVASGVSS